MKFHKLGIILAIALPLAVPTAAWAQTPMFGAAQEIPLYSGTAPGSERWDYSQRTIYGNTGPRVVNVARPTLLHFPAKRGVGTAVIVAPGGADRMLMMSYEGVDIAKKLNEAGVDAFVLKYRLKYVDPDGKVPSSGGPQAGQDIGELSAADGRRAVEVVRSRAAEFKIQPHRVGMIGFSAGGGPIRAAMHGKAETRPDFVAMIYAAGNRGGGAVAVPDGAPPLFLAVAADDSHFLQGSIDTFSAWHAANIPAELHIFQMGAHGFVNQGGGADHFMGRVNEWMQTNGWLTRNR